MRRILNSILFSTGNQCSARSLVWRYITLHDLNVLGPSQDAPRYSGFVEVYPFDILEYRTKDNYNSPMASVDFLQISLPSMMMMMMMMMMMIYLLLFFILTEWSRENSCNTRVTFIIVYTKTVDTVFRAL